MGTGIVPMGEFQPFFVTEAVMLLLFGGGVVLGVLIGRAWGLRREVSRARAQTVRMRALVGMVEAVRDEQLDPVAVAEAFGGKRIQDLG